MDSYNEDKKKKGNLTCQEGKNTHENSIDQNTDYGTISEEIDSILGESSKHFNIETKEKETNYQNEEVNITIDTPLKKKEQEQIIHQSPPSINQNSEIKIEEDLFEIASKNEKSSTFPTKTSKKKEQDQLLTDKNKFEINSDKKKNKSGLFKTKQTPPDNMPIQKKQEIKQNRTYSKNNIKIQSGESQESIPPINLVEKPLSENDTTNQLMDNNNQTINNDIHKLLTITDDLLGKLPEEVITEFASSEDFELYKQVMDRIKKDTTYQLMDNNNQTINNDIHKLLTIIDDLLGKLPEEVITEFASSEDFELYKQVMDKYLIGK